MVKKSFLSKKMMKIISLVIVLAVGLFLVIKYFRKSHFEDQGTDSQCDQYTVNVKDNTTDFKPDESKYINWIYCTDLTNDLLKQFDCKDLETLDDKKKCYKNMSSTNPFFKPKEAKEELADEYCENAVKNTINKFEHKDDPNKSSNSIIDFKCTVSNPDCPANTCPPCTRGNHIEGKDVAKPQNSFTITKDNDLVIQVEMAGHPQINLGK